MGERPDQIERHIQRQRDQLGDNFSELEEKVKGAFDWKTQFEEHPGMMLGAALVGGALVAALLPSSSTITSGVRSGRKALNDRWSSYTSRESSQPTASSTREATPDSYAAYSGRSRGPSSETWENLKNAAIGVASTRLSEFIEELVPGFTEHYKKASSVKPTTPFSSVPTPQEHNWQKANGGTDYASHS